MGAGMSKWVLLLVLMLGALQVFASGTYRDFMDAQGRTIRGKVLRYDARARKVYA